MPNLSSQIQELLTFIKIQENNRVVYNDKLFQIYNGDLLKYAEEALKRELSPRAYERAKGRIPAINVLEKTVKKLSKVYDNGVHRESMDESDNYLMQLYSNEMDLNTLLSSSNELLNLHKYFAIEIYFDEGEVESRVIPANKFLVYSDSKTCPEEMTHFIKFVGSIRKDGVPTVDTQGRVIATAEQNAREVALYHIFTENEFMILDRDGYVHLLDINPLCKIPFILGSLSNFELLPTPDSSNLSMAILIPLLLGDLNYSAQFASHSILYGIDVSISNLENNPDAFWSVSSVPGDNKNPSIGTIAPNCDIAGVLNLINTQMQMWLDCKGLKTTTYGGTTAQDALSGTSKMIDQADSTSVIKKQQDLYQVIEKDFWELLACVHNYYLMNGLILEPLNSFTDGFNPDIKFEEHKVLSTPKELLEETKIELELGLTTVKRAIQKVNPQLSTDQVDKIYEEILLDNEQDTSIVQQMTPEQLKVMEDTTMMEDKVME